MTIIHSSDLGWKAGQDISDAFAALAKTFKPGDTFVFDHMYQISGSNIELPENFTLAGGSQGAGLDIIDSATNLNKLLILDNNSVITDLTIKHSNSPNIPPDNLNPQSGVHYHNKISILAEGDNIQILNSHFEGNVTIPLDVTGDNILIEDTGFNGGFYQLRLLGDVDGATIHNSMFQNSLGDGIKTVGGGGSSISNALVSESVFLNNNRDGIDTTGGFKDSVVTNSYFVNNFAGLDIKTIYDSTDDFSAGEPSNENILIVNSEFVDNGNALTVSTEDRGNYLNSQNAEQWASQNIRVEDSIIENNNSGTDTRMFLVKDGYNIHWNNVSFLGRVVDARELSKLDIGLPKDVNGTNVTTGEFRGELSNAYYQSLAGPDWSNITYPTDGTITPVEPVIEPDPISYTPPAEPDPVVEAPAPSNSAPVANDDVATTGQNKTIVVDVLGNDSDSDGDALTLTNVSYSGTTSIVSIENGRIKVNPLSSATEDRVETVVYTVSDGKGGTDTAELKVNVGQVAAPEPQPEPVVEAPVEEARAESSWLPEAVVEATPVDDAHAEKAWLPEAPVAAVSDLLDIFVAYTDTDETLTEIGAGSSIDSNLTDGRPLTIYATSNGSGASIGSVKLSVDGVGTRMENVAPYALFGDSNGDFFGGEQLSEGTYTAELVVYSGRNGSGDVLETVSFDFAVESAVSEPVVTPTEPVAEAPVAEAPQEPDPAPIEVIAPETDLEPDSIAQGPYSQLLDIKLFDTGTDKELFDLKDGSKLSSGDLADRKITLSAEAINADVDIGSVRLELNDGQFSRMENVEPYALFGDIGGDFNEGIRLPDGAHSLILTAYSGKNGNGSVLEQVTLSFEVGDYDSLLVDGNLSTVSSYSELQDTGTATVSNDQSAIELAGSAWKSMDLSGDITKETVLTFNFKSDAEGEIQGIGFVNESDDLETAFFQLDGSQELGIQDFNDEYETGSGFKSYTIPVGEYYTGPADQLVLVNDDDAGLGALSTFDNIGLIEVLT